MKKLGAKPPQWWRDQTLSSVSCVGFQSLLLFKLVVVGLRMAGADQQIRGLRLELLEVVRSLFGRNEEPFKPGGGEFGGGGASRDFKEEPSGNVED